MAINEIGYNNISRDNYDSEELKIESERCRALKGTIETLCTKENHMVGHLYNISHLIIKFSFNLMFDFVLHLIFSTEYLLFDFNNLIFNICYLTSIFFI